MINNVVIEGNVVRDGVLRNNAKGGSFLTFSLANEVSEKNTDGTWGKYVNYIDVVLFGNRAEALAKLLGQGTHVFVKGTLRYSTWEKDGVKKVKHELRADDISLVSKKSDNQLDDTSQQDIKF